MRVEVFEINVGDLKHIKVHVNGSELEGNDRYNNLDSLVRSQCL